MKLTGKCKEDFEKYLDNNKECNKRIDIIDNSDYYGFGCGYNGCETDVTTNDVFEKLPQSMQYGVYVDFFETNKLYVYIKQFEDLYSIYIDWLGHHILTDYIHESTLQEARTKAIVKANEIYNESTKETNNNTAY